MRLPTAAHAPGTRATTHPTQRRNAGDTSRPHHGCRHATVTRLQNGRASRIEVPQQIR